MNWISYIYLAVISVGIIGYHLYRRGKTLQIESTSTKTGWEIAKQAYFDTAIVGYEVGDYIITVECKEISQLGNPSNPTAHYHGTYLGCDPEKQEVHVALYGMGMYDVTDGDTDGKYLVAKTGDKMAHEWMAININKILSNETLRERQGKPRYGFVETVKI